MRGCRPREQGRHRSGSQRSPRAKAIPAASRSITPCTAGVMAATESSGMAHVTITLRRSASFNEQGTYAATPATRPGRVASPGVDGHRGKAGAGARLAGPSGPLAAALDRQVVRVDPDHDIRRRVRTRVAQAVQLIRRLEDHRAWTRVSRCPVL